MFAISADPDPSPELIPTHELMELQQALSVLKQLGTITANAFFFIAACIHYIIL